MKKQFTLKAIQAPKNIILSAAKNESASFLRLIVSEDPCCPWLTRIQGLAPQPTFTL